MKTTYMTWHNYHKISETQQNVIAKGSAKTDNKDKVTTREDG